MTHLVRYFAFAAESLNVLETGKPLSAEDFSFWLDERIVAWMNDNPVLIKDLGMGYYQTLTLGVSDMEIDFLLGQFMMV